MSKEELCDVCNENMYDEATDTTYIGVSVDLSRAKEFGDKIKKRFGKNQFDICYSCWLESLGLKRVE